jgi:hypothetical protein
MAPYYNPHEATAKYTRVQTRPNDSKNPLHRQISTPIIIMTP